MRLRVFRRNKYWVTVNIIVATVVLIALNYLYLYYSFQMEIQKVILIGNMTADSIRLKLETPCVVSNVTKIAVERISQTHQYEGYDPTDKDWFWKCVLFPFTMSFRNFPPNKCQIPLEFKEMILWNSTIGDIFYDIGTYVGWLKTCPVIFADNLPKGTQLKLLLHFQGDTKAIFKPKWYDYEHVIPGAVYAGKDRHYGEVVAFYLSVLLHMPRVPFVAIRNIDLISEIKPVSSRKLKATFLEGNRTCFYGVCSYCKPEDAVCANQKGILEGAVTFYLSDKFPLKKVRHPWQRTYKCNKLSRWQMDEFYCGIVRKSPFYNKMENEALLMDLIDVSIFDFLIDNGDRHHYEVVDAFPKRRVFLVDNGKSFGNPAKDHLDILAPLYQCCMLRNSTLKSLLRLKGGNLTKWLRHLLNKTRSQVFMRNEHFQAMERRLSLIFKTINFCFAAKGESAVLVLD